MLDNLPDELEQEIAFLEAGDDYLRDPSEANWQAYYALFKTLIGPLSNLDESENPAQARAAAQAHLHELFGLAEDTDPASRFRLIDTLRGGVAARRSATLTRRVVVAVLLALIFVLGLGLGRFGSPGAASQATGLAHPGSATDAVNLVSLHWTPVAERWQGSVMVLVPAGCWEMGRTGGPNTEQPVQHYCIAQPFWMDQTEVTNAQYGSASGAGCDGDALRGNLDAPRGCVSWQQAQNYCLTHGQRLPTEAEWEWAARGSNSLLYPWGNQFDAEKAVALTGAVSRDHAASVGSIPAGASWVGALDMSGNVWEWTSSIYDPVRFPYPYNPADGRENLQDVTSERVMRGGAWDVGDAEVTSTYRGHAKPDAQLKSVGVRCVRDITQELS